MNSRKALAIFALIVAPTIAFAQGTGESKKNGGASQMSPGHEMQQKGSKPGSPGASGYAPGHEMQDKGSKKGQPGASGYAPGQSK
jgi:hypothetical protein